jgi:ribosome maturation factor RimP
LNTDDTSNAGHAPDAAADGTAPSTERFLRESGLAAQLAVLIEPTLIDMGFRLVRIVVGGKDKILQIMAERPDGSITIDDCEAISKQVSPLLDVNDIIASAYRLEVSSPGIDRPLVRPSDFVDWQGYEAKIELSEPVDGRRRFKGRLEGFEDGEVLIECDLDQVGVKMLGFPAALISDAKLVLTDELIREALTRAKKGRPADGIELDETDYDKHNDAHDEQVEE